VTGSRRPEGFALPLVLVALAMCGVLALSAGTTAWRALRSTREAATATRVQLAVDEVLAAEVEAWRDGRFVTDDLGITRTVSRESGSGVPVRVRALRSHPLVLWLSATAHDPVSSIIGAEVRRTVWLAAPELPLEAALIAVPAVSGAAVAPLSDPAAVHAAVDAAWPLIVPQAAPRTSWPRRGLPSWGAAQLPAGDSILDGPLRWRGLLVHDGALTVRGAVEIDGVLLVRGSLEARGAQLTVRGALLVADRDGPGAIIDPSASLTWDPERIAMALATVARPRLAPFRAWQAVTP
jgi:hypothetical protein